MRGTKQEWAPGRWRLRVYVGRSDNGQPQQMSRNVQGNVGEADAALRKFMAEIEKGRTRLDNPTVERVLEAWMANRRNATPLTRAGDQGYIDKSFPSPRPSAIPTVAGLVSSHSYNSLASLPVREGYSSACI
jgi:hypothetical protein